MKKTRNYLIALLVLMINSLGAMAQGGLTPLVGSTHVYTVTPGNAGNTKGWSVVEGAAGTDYVLTNGTTASASIKWITPGIYTLKFTETNTTTSCATVKQTSVTVSNAFDVTATTSLAAICNSATGQINYSGSNATTSITFPVTMVTGVSGFNPNWEFTFTLTTTPSLGVSIANVKEGATTLTDVSGTYTATAISSALGVGSVNITLDVTGDIYTVLNVAFAITSAKELDFNTPDKDSDDWTSSQTINAIPQTSTISTD